MTPNVQAALAGGGGSHNLTAPEISWTAFTANFTAGSTCSSGATVTISGGSFDDLSLTSSATGSTNLLTNGGFENGATTANWNMYSGARPTTSQENSGVTSLVVPASGYATQSITGVVSSSTYTVTAWYRGSGTASLQVGTGTAVTGGASAGWTLLSATGSSSSSGTLLITVQAPVGAAISTT